VSCDVINFIVYRYLSNDESCFQFAANEFTVFSDLTAYNITKFSNNVGFVAVAIVVIIVIIIIIIIIIIITMSSGLFGLRAADSAHKNYYLLVNTQLQ
jgi:hypothetical protein